MDEPDAPVPAGLNEDGHDAEGGSMTIVPRRRLGWAAAAVLVTLVATTVGLASEGAGIRAVPAAAAESPWLLGYFPGYQRDLMPADEIEWSALTHVVVGPVIPRADGSLDTAMDIDAASGPAFARDLAIRAHAHGVVPLLMIGGAGTHDAFAAAAHNHPAALVRNLLSTMDDLGYDGLDLDWEPVPAADEADLAALAHALRVARPSAVLTMPVGWATTTFPDVSSVYGSLADDLDRINVMSYGMAGAWDGWQTWHSSALHGAGGATPSAVDVSVAAYLDAGVPAAKLGVGIGFYGSCWAGGVTGPRQAVGGSALVADDNVMSITNIRSSYADPSASRYDSAAQAPYLSFATPHGPQRCTFVSYEDETSIQAKGAWARSQGLGGAIVWSIPQAHDRAAPAGERDHLLAVARSAFVDDGTPTGTVRPDALLKRAPAGTFVGADRYGTDGTGQTLRSSLAAGSTATFVARLENDGDATGPLTVHADGATSAFAVRYLVGGVDVTRAVRAGTFASAPVASGSFVRLTVRVTARTSAPPGATLSRLITVGSPSSPGNADAVRLRVRLGANLVPPAARSLA